MPYTADSVLVQFDTSRSLPVKASAGPRSGFTSAEINQQRRSIAVDGRSLMLEEGTGVSTYSEGLVRALGRLDVQREILLDRAPGQGGAVPSYGNPGSALQRLSRWQKALSRKPLRSELISTDGVMTGFDGVRKAEDIFRTAQAHFDLYRRPLCVDHPFPPSIMHWTYPVPIFFKNTVNIYTVHDIIPLSDPHLTSISETRHRTILSRLLPIADHVITVSETSRQSIIGTFGYPEERITNTYEGLPFDNTQIIEDRYLLEYGLKAQGFFLALGTIERRKNINRLIQAYLASKARSPLVLVGPNGWEAETELASAHGHIIDIQAAAQGASGILPLGFLPRPVVGALLGSARALLFPSLAEGFGLPILEAMALGTPVMTSRGGATGELAAEATLLIDPFNVKEIAMAISALETNVELRDTLSRTGLRRAADFSIERYTERLGAVYERFGVVQPQKEACQLKKLARTYP
jgi:glycosyltransferase involved in cell wall biosynthesis